MTDPGLPLTTGEGNTAERLAHEWEHGEIVLPDQLFELARQSDEMERRWHSSTEVCNELGRGLRACHDARREAEAECGRLREQLDAARQALTPFVTRGSGPDRPARAPRWEVGGQYVVWLEKGEWERARAALGVEGPAA